MSKCGTVIIQRSGKGIVWTQELLDYVLKLYETHERKQVAEIVGITDGAIRTKLLREGITAKVQQWTPEEEALLIAAYEKSDIAEEIDLSGVAEQLGRHKSNVCRKARELGLTDQRRRIVVSPKIRMPMFDCPMKLSKHRSESVKKWQQKHGHPRGMLGKSHSPETRRRLSKTGKRWWSEIATEEQKERIAMASARAVSASPRTYGGRGSWQAGWREIGGKNHYYRSRWEANYARYLEWLKSIGEIKDWAHEPEVFWFEKIKRGVRSYKPDFRVWENDGTSALHEVKGWMDSRSKTCLNRMRIYHPQEKIVLIDGPVYRAIRMKALGLVPEWEDSKRDSHA